MNLGYARVSTGDQRLDLQIQALKAAGCVKVYEDQGISGKKLKRPGLDKVLKKLHSGDTLFVWRLDRLGRSLSDLIQLVDNLGKRNIKFKSITEGFDTTSQSGRLVFHMMAVLAEFERSLISERTKAGMISARKRGAKIGRPPVLNNHDLLKIHSEISDLKTPVIKMAKKYNVSERTLRRYLNQMK